MNDTLIPSEHRKACVLLLAWFDEQGKSGRAAQQSSAVVETQSAMAIPYPQISDTSLSRQLNYGQGEVELAGWIYGRETGHLGSSSRPEIVPAIRASWSWAGENPRIQLILALVVAGEDAQSGLNATAFRFETGDEGTAHDYHHAQPTTRLEHRGAYLGGVRVPLHESVPAFPLDADGPVGIVMCALLSLYGRDEIVKMLSQDPYLKSSVQPYLGQLPIFSAMYTARAFELTSSDSNGPSPSPTTLRKKNAKKKAKPRRVTRKGK